MTSSGGQDSTPEAVHQQVLSYQALGQKEEASRLLFSYLSQRRIRIWSHDLERLMLMLVGIALDSGNLLMIEEPFFCFRNACQDGDPGSMEKVSREIITRLRGHIESSIQELQGSESTAFSLSALLSHVGSSNFHVGLLDPAAGRRDSMRRDWSSLVWAFSLLLDALSGHRSFEALYTTFAKEAMETYRKYSAYKDLSALCGQLRTHQKEIVDAEPLGVETRERLIELRFFTYKLASEAGMPSEAFEALEDARKLLDNGKRLHIQMARYYRALAEVFRASGLVYFQACCMLRCLEYHRKEKDIPAVREAAAELVAAVAALPPDTQESSRSGGDPNRQESSLPACYPESSLSPALRAKCLALLADSESPSPTPRQLDAFAAELVDQVESPLRESFLILTGRKELTDFAERLPACLEQLASPRPIAAASLRAAAPAALLRQVGRSFATLSLAQLNKLASFVPPTELRRALTAAQFNEDAPVSVDLDARAATFGSRGSAPRPPAAASLRSALARLAAPATSTRKAPVSPFTPEAQKQWTSAQADKIKADAIDTAPRATKHTATVGRDESAKPESAEKEAKRNRKIIEEKRKRIRALLDKYPDVTLEGRGLATFADYEVLQINIGLIDDLEEKIKREEKDKIRRILERKFREFDFLIREAVQKFSEVERPLTRNFAEIAAKRREIDSKNSALLENFRQCGDFVQMFKSEVREQRETKYAKEIEEFKDELVSEFRPILLAEAEAQYLKAEEAKKEQAKAAKAGGNFLNIPFSGLSRGTMKAERGPTTTAPPLTTMAAKGSGMAQRGEGLAQRGEAIATRGEGMAHRGEGMAQRGEGMAQRGEAMAQRGEAVSKPAETPITLTRNKGPVQASAPAPLKRGEAAQTSKPQEPVTLSRRK